MYDWEEGDSLSFEDSERFDEDSLCSWMSERESVCNNWRGWKKPTAQQQQQQKYHRGESASVGGQVCSLVELAAREVAGHIPFEVVEHVYPPVPEQLQLRIAFWSFPESEEDIRLYSCLATGSADEFNKGEHLFKTKATRDLLQIGFHLSATVRPSGGVQHGGGNKGSQGGGGAGAVSGGVTSNHTGVKNTEFNVAVTFDRCRITSCNCTCTSAASWCSHVVAVCLHRIHQPVQVCLRAPVSESLSRLHRDQLQKFAQYLISELPQQILPTAQRLLDELLSSQQTDINTLRGAPDPTAGASVYEQTSWCLDETTLHESIRKILLKLSMPSPIVFSDVNFLSNTSPPAASEWQSLLRPLRGREPEGIWNLLSIVREMFRRSDRNAIPLLELLTEEILACEPILVWWFNTKVSLHTGATGGQGHRSSNNNGVSHGTSQCSQHTCSSLCDEIVVLWRLAALNPSLSPQDKRAFFDQMCTWHVKVLESVCKTRNSTGPGGNNVNNNNNNYNKRWADIEVFPGFKPALESCLLDWRDYPIQGVTYTEGGACRFYSPYMHIRLIEHNQGKGRPVEIGRKSPYNVPTVSGAFDVCPSSSTRSSLSSEGFNENINNNMDNQQPQLQRRDPSVEGAAAREPLGGQAAAVVVLAGADCGAVAAPVVAPDDEYQMYYYDAAQARAAAQQNFGVALPGAQKQITIPEPEELAKQIKKIEDKLEILFARAEALHAHGHTQEACKLAERLAHELLASPPIFEIEVAQPQNPPPNPQKSNNGNGKRGRGKFNPACHHASLLASATLSKAAFLCQVLGENHADHHYLAFKIGIFGLEMIRPPASTKPLEVKLVNQEQDLVTLLKKIPLGQPEMEDLRDKAVALRERRLVARGEALLPLMLASYIFDALVLSNQQPSSSKSSSYSGVMCNHRMVGDEELGFEAAVAALGLKANVSEAEHPLLCEGTRRQRGDLAITLLVHYKDHQQKLAMIMDKLLDKEVHQMYKNPPNNQASANLYGSEKAAAPSPAQGVSEVADCPGTSSRRGDDEGGTNSPPSGWEEDYKAWEAKFRCTNFKAMFRRQHTSNGMASIDSSAPETTSSDNSPTLIRRRVVARTVAMESSDSGSSGESSDSFASSSSGGEHKVKVGVATQVVPPTTATPTTLRQPMASQVVPVNQVQPQALYIPAQQQEEPSQQQFNPSNTSVVQVGGAYNADMVAQTAATQNRNIVGQMKNMAMSGMGGQTGPRGVYKGGSKRTYHPSIPNQPSEASAHFMFELAKTVFTKAGGNNSMAVHFTQPSSSQNHRGPHRALHMCSFQIGLYALGLTNAVSPNWLSRTYSSLVSWITSQAMEIGCAAIMFLIDTWEGHLTPTEVVTLADKASRGRDPPMQRACAQLALSCLPHAHALNQNEIQRALIQCKEQSSEMLRHACITVESAAQGGGVIPEVLFDVARRWFDLYEESLGDQRPASPLPHPQLPSMPQVQQQLDHMFMEQAPMQMPPQLPPYPHTYMPPPGNPYAPYHALPPPFVVAPSGAIHPAYLPQYPPYPPPHQTFYTGAPQPQAQYPRPQMLPPHHPPPMLAPMVATPPTPAPPPQNIQMQPSNQNAQSQVELKYLLSAYRVGILAMDLLAKKIHDERQQAKYARTPPYGEDVKWLLGVAKKLGTNYLQDLCMCVVNSVASPFILHDIITETAQHLAKGQPGGTSQILRSHLLTTLIQKCQQMFIACIHVKIYHITPAEYDDFISIIRAARQAFVLSPGGLVQFSEHLQTLRRSKSCKKDLWARIANAQQQATQQGGGDRQF